MKVKIKFVHSALPASGSEIRKSLGISCTLYNKVIKEIKKVSIKE